MNCIRKEVLLDEYRSRQICDSINILDNHGNPLQYFCLENPHGKRSLMGYSPWGCKELDVTQQLSIAQGNVNCMIQAIRGYISFNLR